VAAYAPSARARALARAAFPRRRPGRLVVVEGASAFERTFRFELVDAALVDLTVPSEDTWRAAAMAREYPSAPFFAITPLRPADGPTLARCAALDFADVLVDGVDGGVARDLVFAACFSARFARALRTPPATLGLETELQLAAWRAVVAQAGRRVRTDALARRIGVTREHLSRAFSAGGAPNLKRVIDLVRIAAAAELAKNPGYDARDVARVLDFSSASHLSTTAQRVVGTRPASLARLRAVDLVERFAAGRTRSRQPLRADEARGDTRSP
jgi:AraC-like DNA-binding protein